MGAEAKPADEIPMEEEVDSLLEAARYDDLDDLKGLESGGISLDAKDSQGRTALHMAAANGHHGIVEYLISKGVVRRCSPVFTVLQGGGADSVEFICNMALDAMYMFIVVLVVLSDHVLRVFRDLGKDLNALNEEKNSPLHWACLNGHVQVVKTLILAGANVSVLNSHERTPIDEALSRGKMDVIDAINEAVAQVELTQARVS
ncbi:hypothetical protein Cgig2_020253 [Carnegiea gigantea]|uniref:Uncharacterized protein n=1 Tax=Carnegiea gigantea TaxID=171969 RepID=A0A9Q1QR45_9CARY|nr:hypothetical protein Cgig2_020253 [Carnegiea gigantea]